MVKRVLQRQAFGWYLRVRHDGWLEQGMAFQLQDRPYPQWTVKEVERIMAAASPRTRGCPAAGGLDWGNAEWPPVPDERPGVPSGDHHVSSGGTHRGLIRPPR